MKHIAAYSLAGAVADQVANEMSQIGLVIKMIILIIDSNNILQINKKNNTNNENTNSGTNSTNIYIYIYIYYIISILIINKL